VSRTPLEIARAEVIIMKSPSTSSTQGFSAFIGLMLRSGTAILNCFFLLFLRYYGAVIWMIFQPQGILLPILLLGSIYV
jgi:hypothetical protein